MIKVNVSETDIDVLRKNRFLHPALEIQRRSEILLLYAHEIPNEKIAKIFACHRHTVRNVVKRYRDHGLSGLASKERLGRQSALAPHSQIITESLEKQPVRTINEACARIHKITGIKRKPSQVRSMLRHLGFRRLVSGAMPCPKKKTPQEHAMDQDKFLKNTLQPLLDECKKGTRDVFFVDAAHFVFASFVCFLWAKVRQWVRAASGRQRHNVLGALHATKHELVTVANNTYVTAVTVCDLFRKLRTYASPGRLITVVLDNAKYQTCDLVKKCAEDCSIDICFLPTYSPNLNLIERYWKHVKKTCLYGSYYASFAEFRTAIDRCIHNPDTKSKTALQSLLSLNFQTFKDVQIYAA